MGEDRRITKRLQDGHAGTGNTMTELSQAETDFLKESNAIEGVYGDTALRDAGEAWDYVKWSKNLTLETILRTHAILMRGQPIEMRYKGAFRTIPVYIGNKEAIDAKRIREQIKNWLKAMNGEPRKDDDWKSLHVWYEEVHPFVDGNGRTGRIFMNWYRVRNGLPILVIHAGEEQYEYYKWFD